MGSEESKALGLTSILAGKTWWWWGVMGALGVSHLADLSLLPASPPT